jgi:hypothetical protein
MPSWLTNSGPRLPTGVEDLQLAEASQTPMGLRCDSYWRSITASAAEARARLTKPVGESTPRTMDKASERSRSVNQCKYAANLPRTLLRHRAGSVLRFPTESSTGPRSNFG